MLRYLLYKLFVFWRDISHSRENKCNQLQPKGNVEKAETRDITDLSLVFKYGLRTVFKNEGGVMNEALLITAVSVMIPVFSSLKSLATNLMSYQPECLS